MKCVPSFTVRHLALVAFSSACLSVPTLAQSTEDTFREGVELYLQNKTEEALQKFQQVLAENPSNEEALALFERAGRETLILMLNQGGEFSNVAQRFFELARLARKEKTDDEAAIAALVEKATQGNYLDQRDAISQLSADHGEYGAAALVPLLASEDDEKARVQAIYALSKMSRDAVLPLLAALDSGDERMTWNAVACLGAIKDERALPSLKRVYETAQNPLVKDSAATAIRRICGKEPGALAPSLNLFREASKRLFVNDGSLARPFDTADAVWQWDGSRVAAVKVPAILRPYKLAEQMAMAALPDPTAQALLTASYAAQKASVLAASEMEMEMDSDLVNGLLAGTDVALAAAGPERISEALRLAIAMDSPHSAVVLIQALRASGAATEALNEALKSPYKMVRYEAAFALAWQGNNEPTVVAVLAEALGEDALRTVLVVDDNDDTRNQLAGILADKGFAVVAANNGGLGFARSRSFPTKDLVIVRAGLKDVTVDQFVYDADFRASASPIVILSDAAQAESLSTMYQGKGKVAGFLTEPFTADVVLPAVEGAMGDLNRERAAALRAAEEAAKILAHLPRESLAAHTGPLLQALGRDEESVLVPVLYGLATVGPSDAGAVNKVAAVFSDASRSEAVRVAAARALGGMFAALSASPGDDILTSVVTAARNDESNAVRVAAGQALGWARFLTDDQRAELISKRQ